MATDIYRYRGDILIAAEELNGGELGFEDEDEMYRLMRERDREGLREAFAELGSEEALLAIIGEEE